MLDFRSTVFGVERRDFVPIDGRPVIAYEDRFPAAYVYPAHTHDRSQLSFSLSGVMSVTTDDTSFILPPNRALWIPANKRHEVACRSDMHFQIVYVDPEFGEQPSNCRVFDVTLLMRALIHEITTFDYDYDMEGREGRIVRMLLEEIARMPMLSLHTLMPTDVRLRRICDAIIASPSDDRGIAAWSDDIGMSRRTFTRTFKRETGMSFAAWRQQARLMEAVARLSVGESVTSVAYAVGYESPGAFTAMFQRALGSPPSAFRGALPGAGKA